MKERKAFERILSLVLALVMLVGMVPATALPVFAAGTAYDTATTANSVTAIRTYAENLLNSNFQYADDTAKVDKNGDGKVDPIFTWDTEGKGDTWRYFNGVMLDAFLKLGVDSDAGNALKFVYNNLDANVSDSGTISAYLTHEVDSVPPALSLLTILDTAAVNAENRVAFEKAIHYVYNQLESTMSYEQCGGNLQHKHDASGNPSGGWTTWNIALDGLYMAQPFLMEYANALASGKITNADADPAEIYKEVYERFMWVADYMYDSTTGLYHHAWDVARSRGNGAFWGRAIGWYAVALVEVIDRMPEGEYKTGLIAKLPKLFDGMLQYQDGTTGLWRNVVNNTNETITNPNDNKTYANKLETSVTSLMSYALLKAYNEGWTGDAKYGQAGLNAFNGIVANKLSNNSISDVYQKSGADAFDAYYCMNEYVPDEAKGVGAVLMAASIANDVAKKLNNESAEAETFTASVVYAPYAAVEKNSGVYELTDKSDVKITLLGSKGTLLTLSGDDEKLSYTVKEGPSGSAGNTTVTALYDGVEVASFQAASETWINGTYADGESTRNVTLWIPRTAIQFELGTDWGAWQNASVTIYEGTTWNAVATPGINWDSANYKATFSVTSSNESVVKYEYGNLTVKGLGTAQVTVKVETITAPNGTTYSISGAAATIAVTVTEPVSHNVGLAVTPGTIEVGGTATLVGMASASDGVDHTYTYSYSVTNGTGAATLSDNTLTATAAGTVDVTVTATAADGSNVSKTVTLTVSEKTEKDTTLYYVFKDDKGNALGEEGIVLSAGDVFTPYFAVLQAGTDVTGAYAMTALTAEENAAIDISGTTITAKTVFEQTTVPVTATIVQASGAAATADEGSITSTFNVTVEAASGTLAFKDNVNAYNVNVMDTVQIMLVNDDQLETPTEVGAQTYTWTVSDPEIASIVLSSDVGITIVGHRAGTVVVKAVGNTTGSVGIATVTVTGADTTTETSTYYLDNNGVDDGSDYLIVYDNGDSAYAVYKPANASDRVAIGVPVTLSSDKKSLTVDSDYTDGALWTFTADGSNGAYKVSNDARGSTYYLRSGNPKILNTSGQNVHVSKTDGAYTVCLNNQAQNGNYLKYLVDGGYWNQSSSESEVYLYKAEWVVDCSGSKSFRKDTSSAYDITEEAKSWTFTSTTDEGAGDLWDGPVLVVDLGGGKTACIRLDDFGWIDGELALGDAFGEDPTIPANWLNTLKAGVTVTVTAQMVNGNVVLGIKAVDSNNTELISDVYILPANSTQTTVSFSGEECVLTNLDENPSDSVDISKAVAAAQSSKTESVSNASLTVFPDGMVLAVGETETAYVIPKLNSGYLDWHTVTYSIADTDIATVDGATGVVTGKSGGVTTLTATVTPKTIDGIEVTADSFSISIPVVVEDPSGTLTIPSTFQIATEMTDGNQYLITHSAGERTAYWDGTAWGICQTVNGTLGTVIGQQYTPEINTDYVGKTLTLWTWEQVDAMNKGHFYVEYNGEKWYLSGESGYLSLSKDKTEATLVNVSFTTANGSVNTTKIIVDGKTDTTGMFKVESSGTLSAGAGTDRSHMFTPVSSTTYNLTLSAGDVSTTYGATDAKTSVVLKDSDGNDVTCTLSYIVMDEDIVTVAADGTITTKGIGTTEVVAVVETVTVDGKTTRPADAILVSFDVTVTTDYSIEITSPADKAALNGALSATATSSVTKGIDTHETEVRWSSSDESVLTVDSNGKITMYKAGSATITAALYYTDGTWIVSDSVEVTVKMPSITVDDLEVVKGVTGAALAPVVIYNGKTVEKPLENGYTFQYEVISGSSVSVDGNGVITTNSVGDTTVQVSIVDAGGNVIASNTAVVEVITIESAKLNKEEVTMYLGEDPSKYASELEMTVHYSDGPSKVVSGKDLTIDWTSVDVHNKGQYTVHVTYQEGSETITKSLTVTVKALPTDVTDWQPIIREYPVYQRVSSIQDDVAYVLGLMSYDGDLTVGNSLNDKGILPILANWEAVLGTSESYYNTGDEVVEWYFDEVGTESINGTTFITYKMYYLNSSGERVYIRQPWKSDTVGNDMNFVTCGVGAATTWYFVVEGTEFKFYTRSQGRTNFVYNTAGIFRVQDAASDASSFYLYAKVPDSYVDVAEKYATLQGVKAFDYIAGEVTEDYIWEQIQEYYDVFLADDTSGTNDTHMPWSSDRITYEYVDSDGNVILPENFDPTVVEDYTVFVKVDGQRVHTEGISLQMHSGIDYWTLNKYTVTVPLNGNVDISGFIATAYDEKDHQLLVRQGDEIEFDFAGATLDGKKKALDTTKAGAVYTVPVMYNGVVMKDRNDSAITITVIVSDDPYYGRLDAEDEDYSGYPDVGSVKFNKWASVEGTKYNSTGVAKLELTAAGVTDSSNVDVVLIVDISNSMAWTDTWFNMPASAANYPSDFVNYLALHKQYVNANPNVSDVWDNWANGVDIYNGTTRVHTGAGDPDKISINSSGVPVGDTKLDQAMDSAQAFAKILLGANSGNTLSFVTFAGLDEQHNSGTSANIDSVHTVFTAETSTEKTGNSFNNTKFYQLTKNSATSVSYYMTLADTEGKALASGLNRGNTNYDYAFGQAYEAVANLKAKVLASETLNPKNAATYEDTGRQLHVVFMTDGAPSHYNGVVYNTNASSDLKWGTTTAYTSVAKTVDDQVWLDTYISPANTLATKLVEQGGVDGFHAVGFDMAHGGFVEHVWNKEDLLGVISGLLRNQVVDVMDAENGQQLIQYYKDLAAALTYSGTDAKVTDQIKSYFTLYTGTQSSTADASVPSDMWIKSYRLVTAADIGSSLVLEDSTTAVTVDRSHIGMRVMKWSETENAYVYDCENIEHVTFSTENGTTSYVATDLVKGTTINGTFTNKIVGHYFTYENVGGTETIEWTIGNITEREIALSYYVYLKGSADDATRLEGNYETNEVAVLEYVDTKGRHAEREYPVPELPWGEAAIQVKFFLVNEKGEYVNYAGETFESENLRIFLKERYTYTHLETNGMDFITAMDAYAKAAVGSYPLYDDGFTVTVIRNAGGTGSAYANGYKVVAGNAEGKRVTDELVKIIDSLGDGSYGKTIIEIPVILTDDLGKSVRPLAPSKVVVDYGKPIDINVFTNEELQYAVGYKDTDVINGKDYIYTMEIIGFAPYNERHVQEDYVLLSSISDTLTTTYGTYSVVSTNGDFQVRFTPGRFFEEVENVFVGVKFAKYEVVYDESGNVRMENGVPVKGEASNDYFCMYKQLTVIPATVMYYETDFADNVFVFHQGNEISGINYTAELLFADSNWKWAPTQTTQITGPGTYTISISGDTTYTGTNVLAVDILNAGEALSGYTVSDISLTVGDESVTVDSSKMFLGSREGYLRLSLYDITWEGNDPDNPEAIDLSGKTFSNLTLRFTLSNGTTSTQANSTSGWTEKTDADEAGTSTEIANRLDTSNTKANRDDGVQDDGTVGNGQTYGYDSTYQDDNMLSEAGSWYVEGTTTMNELAPDTTADPDAKPSPSTYATFTFTGTGFDIISRTGKDQGTIRVWVYDEDNTRVRDVAVINKGVKELYQIPVVSIEDLEHGTYTVVISVYEPAMFGDNVLIDSEFYFDALRIYNPVQGDAVAEDAYAADIEYAPDIREVGQMLIDANEFVALEPYDSINGVIYLDDRGDLAGSSNTAGDDLDVDADEDGEKDTTTSPVTTYDEIGANNEVYLEKDCGIAFKVTTSAIPTGVDIGVKTIHGNGAVLNAEIYASGDVVNSEKAGIQKELNSGTQQYYNMMEGVTTTTLANLFESNEAYVVIWNTGEDILSITDIKLTYSEANATSTFQVTRAVETVAVYAMRSANDYDVKSASFTVAEVATADEAQMTVVTTQDVARLVVTDRSGNVVESHSLYVDTATGDRVWTVTLNPIALGEQTFTVTGYNTEGEAGSSVNATILVTL